MRFYTGNDYEDMSRIAADIIASQIKTKADSVLGLATGSTPIGIYSRLVEECDAGVISFKDIKTVNLDEYKGLSPDDDQSYRYYMNENLFNYVDIEMNNTYVPDGLEQDSDKACSDYDEIIAALGGIDLQLLGLGHNGHIGFNEPNDIYVKNTNCIELTESTIEANKRFFASKEEVPRYAYTMGIMTIMQSAKIILVVSGKSKASIVREAFFGPVMPRVPASILQLHPDVSIVGDKEAFSLIQDLIKRPSRR